MENFAKYWVDSDCSNFNDFVLNARTITNTAKDWAFVFSRNELVGQCSFNVKIIKIGHYGVGLGVSDTQNRRSKGSYTNWIQKYVRYWSDGYCFISGSQTAKGNGFSQGEIVKVLIDLNSGNMQWKVGP